MIVIVLVCIAGAALFAWVAVERGRLAMGALRVPRPAIGPLRPPAPANERERPPASASERERPPAPSGDDVERRVRDRLYGERHGALRRAPLAND